MVYQITTAVTFILLLVIAYLAFRSYGALHERIQLLERQLGTDKLDSDVPIGTSIEDVQLHDLDGQPVHLSSLLTQQDVNVMVVMQTQCPACEDLWPLLQTWTSSSSESVAPLVVISSRERREVEMTSVPSHAHRFVAVDDGMKLINLLGIKATPSAVLVDSNGMTLSNMVGGRQGIQKLFQEAQSGITIDR